MIRLLLAALVLGFAWGLAQRLAGFVWQIGRDGAKAVRIHLTRPVRIVQKGSYKAPRPPRPTPPAPVENVWYIGDPGAARYTQQ